MSLRTPVKCLQNRGIKLIWLSLSLMLLMTMVGIILFIKAFRHKSLFSRIKANQLLQNQPTNPIWQNKTMWWVAIPDSAAPQQLHIVEHEKNFRCLTLILKIPRFVRGGNAKIT